MDDTTTFTLEPPDQLVQLLNGLYIYNDETKKYYLEQSAVNTLEKFLNELPESYKFPLQSLLGQADMPGSFTKFIFYVFPRDFELSEIYCNTELYGVFFLFVSKIDWEGGIALSELTHKFYINSQKTATSSLLHTVISAYRHYPHQAKQIINCILDKLDGNGYLTFDEITEMHDVKNNLKTSVLYELLDYVSPDERELENEVLTFVFNKMHPYEQINLDKIIAVSIHLNEHRVENNTNVTFLNVLLYKSSTLWLFAMIDKAIPNIYTKTLYQYLSKYKNELKVTDFLEDAELFGYEKPSDAFYCSDYHLSLDTTDEPKPEKGCDDLKRVVGALIRIRKSKLNSAQTEYLLVRAAGELAKYYDKMQDSANVLCYASLARNRELLSKHQPKENVEACLHTASQASNQSTLIVYCNNMAKNNSRKRTFRELEKGDDTPCYKP